jgi:peptide/nickel transport system substrate-binding protein
MKTVVLACGCAAVPEEEQGMTELDTLKAIYANGGMSRRDFLAGIAAIGAGTAAGAAMLPELARAETPKKGGTLRLGMEGGGPSDSLDPRTYADSIPIAYSLAIMNGLVEISNTGKAEGELLESWETKPGATEWVFNVRKGIKFSNGKTLDADDVIYSIGLHTGETKSPAKGILAQITEIKKLSDHQIQFTLSDGNADFPYVLSDYHLMVVPNGFTDWSKPIGTGAYTLESFEPGVRIIFKRKPDEYWKKDRGNFDSVEIRYINDKTARTSALQSGQIDGANRLDPRTVNLLKKDPKLNIVRTEGTGNRFCFVSRVTDAPYDNKDLRLALKYGIDRKKIIDQVYAGYASPGNDHTLDALNPYYNKSMPQRVYDPEKAAFHFKKAGLANAKLELQTSDGAWASAVDCAQLYQESLKKAGINLDIKKVAADGYWDNVWLKVPFCAVYWGRRPTADLVFSTVYKSGSSWNDSNWSNAEFDKLVVAARAELDEKKRKEMYFRCQELIAEDGGMVCFAIGDYLDGFSKKVMGAVPHARYDMSDQRVAEKGWFA